MGTYSGLRFFAAGGAVLCGGSVWPLTPTRNSAEQPSATHGEQGVADPGLPIGPAERQPGEENLYREEKYAAVYEINMLRCIFCGLCEEACPKEAIYLDGDIVPADYLRKDFIYGKDKLVEAPLNQ